MTKRQEALYSKAQKAALAASQPFVRAAVDLMSISSHTLIVSGDRVVDVRYLDEVKTKLARLREMAWSEAKRAYDEVLREWS
jgi:hypothetical protein